MNFISKFYYEILSHRYNDQGGINTWRTWFWPDSFWTVSVLEGLDQFMMKPQKLNLKSSNSEKFVKAGDRFLFQE